MSQSRKTLGVVLLLFVFAITACSAASLARKRGDRFYENDQYAKAQAQYEEVIKLEGDSFDVLYSLGNCAQNQNNYALACTSFEKARDRKPEFPDTYEKLGICYGKLGEKDKALTAWETLIKLDAKQIRAHVEVADLLFEKSQYDAAALHYKAYLDAKPDEKAVLASYGATLISLKRYADAYAVLKHAVELDPQFVVARHNLGVALLGLGRNEDAQREFIVVTETSPSFAEGWIHLAAAYCRTGEALKAIEALGRARERGFNDWKRIESDPDFVSIQAHERFLELKGGAKETVAPTAPPVSQTPNQP